MKLERNVRKAVLKTLMHRWHASDCRWCWSDYSPKQKVETRKGPVETVEWCRKGLVDSRIGEYKHTLHLALLGDKDSIPAIRKFLDRDYDGGRFQNGGGLRKLGRASLALSLLGDQESIPRIREIAKEVEEEESETDYGIGYNSSHAFLALSYFGDRELIPLAKDLLKERRDKSGKSDEVSDGRLAIALGVWDDQESIPILRQRIDGNLEKDIVSKYAGNFCIALGLLGDKESIPRIREMRHTEKTPYIINGQFGWKYKHTIQSDAAFGLYLLGEEYTPEGKISTDDRLVKEEVEKRVEEIESIK